MNSQPADQQTFPAFNSTSIINFIPLDKIGEGSFSSVYKVRRITDDKIYALKKIKITSLKDKEKQNALNEIRILASINSQFIVQYKQAFFDHKLNLLCVVMEYADGGDLQKNIQFYRRSMAHIPQSQIWKAAYHTIKGLDILHSRLILHRDIKSANIFINAGVYKLGDLNVSKIQDNVDKLAYTQTGTPYYASPQVWRDQPYDYKSDIWSLGCVLYQMCTYRPPFRGKDLQALYKSVQKGFYEPLPIIYSHQLSQLISCCLKLNAKQRLSCKQLISFIKKSKRVDLIDGEEMEEQLDKQLLKTIILPSDLKELRKKLPKSKYSCSIDNINKRMFSDQNKCDKVSAFKKQDYYLKLAKAKRQQKQGAEVYMLKNNKFIQAKSAVIKNPQDRQQTHEVSINQTSQQQKGRKQYGVHKKINQLKINSLKPYSDRPGSIQRNTIGIEKEEEIKRENEKDSKNKDGELQKSRKFSYDNHCRRSRNKIVLNHISLIKKLSQPSSVHKCLSQRYFDSEKSVQIQKETETERAELVEIKSKKKIIANKSGELAEIEKKMQEKRKELRKIGSIQRLQANSKNIKSFVYNPTAIQSMKKGSAHMSHILLKSPPSTEDDYCSYKVKRQKEGETKREDQLHKVNSTPYIVTGVIDAPRMKKILENLNESKKSKQTEIKSKILSTRYLHKY